MPIRGFKQRLINHVRQTFPELEAVPEEMVTVPPDPEMGDLCLAAFPLAPVLHRSPPEIAAALAEGTDQLAGFSRVEQKGPYLNFFFDPVALARAVLGDIGSQGDRFGNLSFGAGRTVVIDYSSPNIAKPFGIGHLRSTVIGAALYRLYQAAGYEVIGINHLGDWGTQFGLLLTAFEDQGDEAALEVDPLEYCYHLYVEYSAKREADPTVAERARQWFKRLEEGDGEAVARWEKIRDLSLREFKRIYQRLGLSFDLVRGESFYNELQQDTLQHVEQRGLLRRDEGALIVDLSDQDMPPALLVKSDGASTYLLRDLAAAESRAQEFNFDLCLYVIGTPQALHMRQLRAVLQKMGCTWAEGIIHINFGHILGMKTREGNLIFLEQVLDEATQRSRAKIEENQARGWTDPDIDVETISEAVGISAIVFNDLKQNRTHDITFDWERLLSLEGDSGPYLQYAYSRTCGILRKADPAETASGDDALFAQASDQDRALLTALGSLSTTIERAVRENAPHHLCQYLLDLATIFSRWYTTHQVLGSGEWEAPRLALVRAVRQVLGKGMRLLGLQPLQKM